MHAQTACPGAATLVIYADNASGDAAVTLAIDGELRDPAATCTDAGDPTYHATVECRGQGLVRCGVLANLRPGAWVHRVATRVADSAPQRQAQPGVVLTGHGVSNVVTWTVYARTFVVAAADESTLRGEIDAAAAYTDRTGERALVGFDALVFPGADDPRTIDLGRASCSEDGRRAGLCLSGSDVTIDALDARAEPGAVVLSVGGRAASVVRVYGGDDVLRGLVLEGSVASGLTAQADAVVITGPSAQGDRIERSVVRGPSRGDAVSVENGAGAVLAVDVRESEISGAAGVGVKVTTGGEASVRRSCLHDNRNGGAAATLGGTLQAVENLVQHNAPGSAPSGLAAGSSGEHDARSTLVTSGNVVRFNGARGLSVTDAADASFSNDYVSDNQFAGTRVEAVTPGDAPSARYDGVALVCNYNEGLSGTCEPTLDPAGMSCLVDRDCCGTGAGCCVDDPGCATPVRCTFRAPQGFGTVTARCDGCASPSADFGTAGRPGANAFTLNANTYPNGTGANVLQGVAGAVVPARGNQWERCGTGAGCDLAAVADGDVRRVEGADVDIADAVAARAGAPVVTGVSIGRPRAGDLVRIFGRGFNAVDGAACARTTVPMAACSAENPRTERQNRGRYGNLVRLTTAGQTTPVDVVAVTPTMLAFRMPFDCFAPAEVAVSRRDAGDVRRISTAPLCDVGGCHDAAAGEPCDDGSVCTVEDSCGADGRCIPGSRLECGGPCMRCDPVDGCVPQSIDTTCDDGDACTIGDHCSGDGDVCVPGAPASCEGPCRTGTCDPTRGCELMPASAPCDDGNACTIDDHCRGDAAVCVGGGRLSCAGTCLLGSCDPASGCRPKAETAFCSDGNACTEHDHCSGDANVCLAGPAASCDDGDACTIDSCVAPTGCRHDPLGRFDGVRCRLEHVRLLIIGPPGVSGAAGRGLIKLVATCLERGETARAAEARGDRKLERRALARLQGAVRRVLAKVDRPRGFPPTLPAVVRPLVVELGNRVEALRAEANAG